MQQKYLVFLDWATLGMWDWDIEEIKLYIDSIHGTARDAVLRSSYTLKPSRNTVKLGTMNYVRLYANMTRQRTIQTLKIKSKRFWPLPKPGCDQEDFPVTGLNYKHIPLKAAMSAWEARRVAQSIYGNFKSAVLLPPTVKTITRIVTLDSWKASPYLNSLKR